MAFWVHYDCIDDCHGAIVPPLLFTFLIPAGFRMLFASEIEPGRFAGMWSGVFKLTWLPLMLFGVGMVTFGLWLGAAFGLEAAAAGDVLVSLIVVCWGAGVGVASIAVARLGRRRSH